MEKGVRLQLGCPVSCADGPFGELADIVIDPISRRVTHLVVQPHEWPAVGRLVPADAAQRGEDEGITLRMAIKEASELPQVQETVFLRSGDVPVRDPNWDVGVEDVLTMPYYASPGGDLYPAGLDWPVSFTYDRVPKGEVEVRRESAVVSSDGHHLGHVEAFLVDGDAITHLVLERGHLWGRRDVTIPIGAVAGVETDSVTLSLTKDQVGELPALHVHRWRS